MAVRPGRVVSLVDRQRSVQQKQIQFEKVINKGVLTVRYNWSEKRSHHYMPHKSREFKTTEFHCEFMNLSSNSTLKDMARISAIRGFPLKTNTFFGTFIRKFQRIFI